jgi:hypothetical protein
LPADQLLYFGITVIVPVELRIASIKQREGLVRITRTLEVVADTVVPAHHLGKKVGGVDRLELTGGKGVDCVVEIGGPGPIAMSLKASAVGGHVSLIGASLSASGTGLDPLLLTGRGITLGSISVGSRANFEAMTIGHSRSPRPRRLTVTSRAVGISGRSSSPTISHGRQHLDASGVSRRPLSR